MEEPADSDADVPTRRQGGDEPEAADEPLAPLPARRARWPWLVAAFIVVVGVAAIAAWVFVQRMPKMIRERAVAGAAERGFEITMDDVTAEGVLPWDERPRYVGLRGVAAHHADVREVDIDVAEVRVPLQGWDPARVEASGVRVRSPDIPTLLAFEKSLATGPSSKLPLVASDVELRISRVAEAIPLAAVAKVGRATADGGKVAIENVSVELAIPFVDLGVGAVPVAVERAPGRVWLVPERFKKLRLGIDETATRGYVELVGASAEEIAAILPIKPPGKRISAKAELALAGPEAKTGTFDVTLTGFVPPHPPELGGILFGDETKVSGKAAVEGAELVLRDLVVKAGALTLKGTGSVSSLGKVVLELKGSVGCTELAASAVGAHLGFGGSILTRRIASDRLGGFVETRVTVEADLRDMERAKVVPSAVVRCKVSL